MNVLLVVALGWSSAKMLDISSDRSFWWWTHLTADLLCLNSKTAVFGKGQWTSKTFTSTLYQEDCSSIFCGEPTFPLLCCEAEEETRARTSSQRAGSAALWHEGLVERSQTCPVPGVCRADPLCHPDSVHGRVWDLLSRAGLCSVSLQRLHSLLPGWSSLGICSSWEQPGQTWLDQSDQQCGPFPVSLGDYADERQHCSCSHHDNHGTWDITALRSVSAAHLPQLVQSSARHPDHCGTFFSSWYSGYQWNVPRKEDILRLDIKKKYFKL